MKGMGRRMGRVVSMARKMESVARKNANAVGGRRWVRVEERKWCREAAAGELVTTEEEVVVTPLSELGAVERNVGMKYKRLDELPTKKEVFAAIPEHCYKRDTAKSMMYAFISTALTLACGAFAYFFIPLKLAYWPAWVAYALVTGTVATGCWVVAHECGHGAFSDNRALQDAVGYALHSALLVPYFSWQRSHAIHHARTNHLEEGETHVRICATLEKRASNTCLNCFRIALIGIC